MKRSLWVISSVAVLALPVGATVARGLAGNPGNLSGLQQVISSKSVIDLTASRDPCHICVKCPGTPCNHIGSSTQCHPCA